MNALEVPRHNYQYQYISFIIRLPVRDVVDFEYQNPSLKYMHTLEVPGNYEFSS